MADNYIRDEQGAVIGEWREKQDPNFPQRFLEDEDGNRVVDTGTDTTEKEARRG